MTNLEAYQKVKAHLLAQGKKAMHGERCQYLTPDGLRCAIGCLIPIEEYDACFEGHPFLELPYIPTALQGLDEALLNDLQLIHDECPPEQWPAELAKTAHVWGFDQQEATQP